MNILEELLSEEFDDKYICVDLTDSLYHHLAREKIVIELREALKSGAITWDELREVVDQITDTVKPGFSLDRQTALCAIAIAVKDLPSEFTGEFLDVFSRSRAVEIGKVSRIARKCIEYFELVHEL